MNQRAAVVVSLVVVCVVALWSVAARARQISALRAEQRRLLAAFSGTPEAGVPSVAAPSPAAPEASSELLRLRSEVSQLTRRRGELAGVRAENERLRLELASASTSNAGTQALPAGYIRRSQAQFVGYNSPEDTLQSVLWAIQHQDVKNLLQAFANPEKMGLDPQKSPEEIFHGAEGLVGFSIAGKEQRADGSVDLKVQFGLHENESQSIHFQNIAGQWRILE